MIMAYFILAVLAMIIVGGAFLAVYMVGYIFFQKVICGNPKSISDILDEF